MARNGCIIKAEIINEFEKQKQLASLQLSVNIFPAKASRDVQFSLKKSKNTTVFPIL